MSSLTASSRRVGSVAVGAMLLSVVVAAGAYPEGAPWGAANPDAEESCHTCHYDYDPVHDSDVLRIDGLPAVAESGKEYELVVRFNPAGADSSGFQLMAGDGDPRGGSIRVEADAVEGLGAAARSTATRLRDAGFEWTLWWRAPDAGERLTLYVAASSANDDQSPFGDTIHYQQYDIIVINNVGSAQ